MNYFSKLSLECIEKSANDFINMHYMVARHMLENDGGKVKEYLIMEK